MSQQELTRTLDNITKTLSGLSTRVASLDKLLVSHMAAEEIITKNLIDTLNEARADIKALTSHQDIVAHDMQEHIENRVANCNRDIMYRLTNDFMDKNEIKLLAAEIVEQQAKIRRDEITKAIIASENRMDTRMDQKLATLRASIVAKEDKYTLGAKVIWLMVAGGITILIAVMTFLIKYSDIIANMVGKVDG